VSLAGLVMLFVVLIVILIVVGFGSDFPMGFTMRLLIMMFVTGGVFVIVVMVVVIMRHFLMVPGIIMMMFAVVIVFVVMAFIGMRVGRWQTFSRRLRACVDDLALNPFAVAAPARVAMARTAAAGAVLGFLFRLAMGAFVGFDQCLTIGDGDLVIIGVNFAEGEKAVAIAAIFDEGGLQRRFNPRDLCEINIAAQLFALRGLEIKLFDAVAANHNDPGLLRVGGIDKHFVGHFGTLDGGGRAGRREQIARPVDATVHLIRG
jgi:hypothetical protein